MIWELQAIVKNLFFKYKFDIVLKPLLSFICTLKAQFTTFSISILFLPLPVISFVSILVGPVSLA